MIESHPEDRVHRRTMEWSWEEQYVAGSVEAARLQFFSFVGIEHTVLRPVTTGISGFVTRPRSIEGKIVCGTKK